MLSTTVRAAYPLPYNIDMVDTHVYVKQYPTVAISFQSLALMPSVHMGEYGKTCAARTVLLG